ncbi:hypothetical protein SAMN03159312_5427 [Pseudomonas sp. NFIX49]|nr:hypothetical protein SAMN03159313_2816 [Pseudomonas sp. NFIX46]SDB26883.1 hypothetical protein SAMN03097715_02037 [Pseudomonas putida]SFQ93188.1 hypothetical protein SAMN03159312_5427 [Pseudomonas sp. NFIX49]
MAVEHRPEQPHSHKDDERIRICYSPQTNVGASLLAMAVEHRPEQPHSH